MSQATYQDATTSVFSGTLRVESTDASVLGDPIPLANITEFYLKLSDGSTGSIVNSRTGVANLISNLSAANLTIHATSGALAWNIQALDTTLLDQTKDLEEHIAEFRWVYTAFGSNAAGVGEAVHRLICEKSTNVNLCTFEDVSLVRALSETDRPLIEAWIRAFTDRVADMTGRVFKKSTVAAPYTEVHSPIEGQRTIQVSAYPIDSVVSLKESLGGNFANSTSYTEGSDFAVVKDNGWIRMNWRPFYQWEGSVQVVYAGGLARETAGVPPRVRMAAAEQIAYRHARKDALGIMSESIQGMSVAIYAKDMLPYVEAVADFLYPISW